MKQQVQVDLNPYLEHLTASGMPEAQAIAILEVLAKLVATTLATRAEVSAVQESVLSLASSLGVRSSR